MTTRFMGKLVNNTGQDLRGMFEDAIRDANFMPLPEEIADIFSVRRYVADNGEERMIVDFADV